MACRQENDLQLAGVPHLLYVYRRAHPTMEVDYSIIALVPSGVNIGNRLEQKLGQLGL